MPWREQVSRLKGEWVDLLGRRSQQQQQQQQQQGQQQYYPPQQYTAPPPVQAPFPGYPAPPTSQAPYSNNQPPPQQQFSGYPPPNAPLTAAAGAATTQTVYWQPRFHPDQPLPTEWDVKQGNNNGWGNAELQNYTGNPENVFFTPDNKLVLRAVSRPSHPDQSQKYTSARLVSRHTLTHPRGSLLTTLSLPCAPGIWPAFWLLPREPFVWPHDGEVDLAETWNGDLTNHSCLHWGFFTGEDAAKHRAVETRISEMATREVRFEWAWEQQDHNSEPTSEGGRNGRMVFWIDGVAVMKAVVPAGMRPLQDFQVVINIAMGGNVCQGRVPGEGSWEMVVHELVFCHEPGPERSGAGSSNGGMRGWERFERDWRNAPEGHTM